MNSNGVSSDAFVKKLSILASLSGLLFGYDTGVVSGAIVYLRPEMNLSDFETELVVGSTILSAAFSALLGGYCLEAVGRKRTLVYASFVFVIGSVVLAFAPSYGILVFGRVIVGIAIGFASDAGPLYISECAPPSLRGSLTTLFNIAVVAGQVFASIICGLFSFLEPTYNWRLMLGFGAVPALIQIVGFSVLPLSPTWLVIKGRTDEAERVLRMIRPENPVDPDKTNTNDGDGNSGNPAQPDPILEELHGIMEEHEQMKRHRHVSTWHLWRRNPAMRRIMTLGCALWAISQFAGINTIMYYGASIVRESGIDGSRSVDIWVTVPLNSMQLFGIMFCYTIIDKKGRRPTLLTSTTLVGISLFTIGLGFAIDSGPLTVVAMCMYLFSFGMGLSTMPYTMNAEIYPVEYREQCVAQANFVFWMSNFLVSVTFLTFSSSLGNQGVFFLYTAIVILGGTYFFFRVPETSGLSLHEIQEHFHTVDYSSIAGGKSSNGTEAGGTEENSEQMDDSDDTAPSANPTPPVVVEDELEMEII